MIKKRDLDGNFLDPVIRFWGRFILRVLLELPVPVEIDRIRFSNLFIRRYMLKPLSNLGNLSIEIISAFFE